MKEQKKVKVLSLFDGMACGMIAMQSVGLDVEEYYAYEIDKYAIQTALHNFPNIKELGDVFKADYTQYKGVDYLIGGSPCQHWSIAQSPDRRETVASGIGWGLFSQYVRALKEAEPKYFIYENNKSMANGIYDSISNTFGFEPIMINSTLVSAQNRQRLYWVGQKNADGTYSKVDVQQPADRRIFLTAVLDGVTDREKSRCLIGSIGRTTTREYYKKFQGEMTYEPVDTVSPIRCFTLPRKDGVQTQSKQYRVYDIVGKSTTICAEGGGMGAKTGLYAIPIEFDGDIPIKAKSNTDGKSHNVYRVERGFIKIKDKFYPVKLPDGYYIIRKLTVAECKRLQTVPEWYEFPVSDTQAYKCLGNGWTCEVIAHLIRATLK